MPTTRVESEVIVAALQLACRAPSLHNSQPWRWVATDHSVELFVDPGRMVRSTDPTGREALLSCGAVLHHFLVAMAAAGWASTVARFPDQEDPQHLATIEFSSATASEEHANLADAILVRRTDRLPLAAPPDWTPSTNTLSPAESGKVHVAALSDAFRGRVAEASQLAESMRLYNSDYHSELSSWTVDCVAHEGIPSRSLVSAAECDRVEIGRSFPVVPQRERRGEIDEDHARILILSTDDDSPDSVLRCGETLSAVLLQATAERLATCTLTHVIEVSTSRDIVASLIPGSAIPQVLVRVGLASPLDATPAPTPRRPIEQVLQILREAKC